MMSAPRVPPIPPNKAGELDKSPPTSHRKVEKVEKVGKVDETDNESRARQKFRQLVDAEPEEPSNLPSPFSVFASTEVEGPSTVSFLRSSSMRSSPPPTIESATPQDPSLADAAETAIPNPSYSASPSTVLRGDSYEDSQTQTPLPRSQEFYESSDDLVQPNLQETPRSASRSFATDQDKDTAKKSGKKESSTLEEEGPKKSRKKTSSAPSGEFSPLNGPIEKSRRNKKEELAESTSAPEETSSEEQFFPFEAGAAMRPGGPVGIIPKTQESPGYVGPLEEEKISDFRTPEKGSPLAIPGQPEVKRSVQIREEVKKEDREFRAPIQIKEAKVEEKQEREEKREDRRKKSEEPEASQFQIDSPSLTSLPSFAIPVASAAAAAATPYLGPEALAVYFHMVGTITAMVTPKGDSRTEFILNAPQFAGSKFYGSTISIERFSTAPYQINIRLTGSNEAVTAFNQNIPNLLAAFQNGKFSYTVNRIEAVYEKPLFRRKESAGEKGDKGFGGGMDQNK